jgi:hypothetical protein
VQPAALRGFQKLKVNKMKKQERKLKVGYKFQNRAFHQMVMIPEIILTGKWLKECGFNEGQQVNVIVKNKKLVIVPLE